VTGPAVVPVTVTEQVPAAVRAHEAGEGRVTAPEPPAWIENVTVSPVTVPAKPAKVAVQEEVAVSAIGDAHMTVVVVVLGGAGANLNHVVIVAVLLDPPHVALTL